MSVRQAARLLSDKKENCGMYAAIAKRYATETCFNIAN